MANLGSTTTRDRPRQFARELINNRIGKVRYKRTEKEMALSLGYAQLTAKNPQVIKRTQAFKEETSTFIEKLEAERNRVLRAMSIRNLSPVKYNQLSDVLKNLTHDHQLLSGGVTDRVGDKFGEELSSLIADIRQANTIKQVAIEAADHKELSENASPGPDSGQEVHSDTPNTNEGFKAL